MNKDNIKHGLYLLGKLLGLIGLVFVFYTLWQEYTWSTFTEKFNLLFPLFPFLILFNILSVLVGIYAWHMMLRHYASEPFAYFAAYYYFCKTEIAKYLPGNIFHFIGRQALASNIGMTQVQMAKTSLLFSFLLLSGTLLTSTLFAFLSLETPIVILTLMAISSIISVIVLVYLYPSFPMGKKLLMHGYLALSVALQGIMLATIILYQTDVFSIYLFLQCVSIYTVSWLIGFVTPGASGGLGIREGTFIFIANYLHLNIASDIVIFSVLLVRLINICVDALLYLSTYTLENKMKELKL